MFNSFDSRTYRNMTPNSNLKIDGDNLYYSVNIIHNDPESQNGYPTEANFLELRSQPILEKPSDYRLAITRFAIAGSVLPIQIVPIQYNVSSPTDVNQTIYSITLQKGATTTQVFLEFIPRDNTVFAPPAGYITPTSPPINPDYSYYYSLYDFQTFCDMMNIAFATAFATLSGITSTKPPVITFNRQTELFTIYVQKSYLVDNISVYFNIPVYNLFNNTLTMFLLGYQTLNGKDAQLIIEDTYNNTLAPSYDPSGNYFAFTQEFPNINTTQWQALTQIVVTSDLPVKNQLMPNIDTNSSVIVQSKNNFKPILTDFNVLGQNYRQGLVYNPTAQYRYLTLMGNNPISSVNIQLYWVDNYQNYYPIFLAAHDTSNLLLLFEKIK